MTIVLAAMTALVDRFFGLGGSQGPVADEDLPMWEAAQSLDDLCILTVGWLEGRVPSLPGYYGSVDVDDADGLKDALILLNQNRILTTDSQKSHDGPGYDGRYWTQYAAVAGFADPARLALLDEIVAVSSGELDLVAHPVRPRFRRGFTGVGVTLVEGRPFTAFGGQQPRREIAWLYGDCADLAVDALCAAEQFALFDTEPGRDTVLWSTILEVLT